MGTGHQSLATVRTGMGVCDLFARGKNWHHRSRAVTAMAMGSYNKKFEPARTKVDWLTKDNQIVDKYCLA